MTNGALTRECFVTEVLAFAYLCGWGLAASGLYLASRQLSSNRTASPHRLPLSILAGGLWPLLLLGVVEIGSIVAAAKAMPHRRLRDTDCRPDDGAGDHAWVAARENAL